jgi:hypothetical protein
LACLHDKQRSFSPRSRVAISALASKMGIALSYNCSTIITLNTFFAFENPQMGNKQKLLRESVEQIEIIARVG